MPGRSGTRSTRCAASLIRRSEWIVAWVFESAYHLRMQSDDPPGGGPPSSELPALPVERRGRTVGIAVAAIAMLAAIVCGAMMLGDRLAEQGRTRNRPEPKVHRAAGSICGASPHSRGRRPDLLGCESDAECTNGKNARCQEQLVKHAHAENRCVYDGCSADADCRGGEADDKGPCVCGKDGDVNRCLSGNCSTDADCGKGGWCSPSYGFKCGYEDGQSYWCHTADDLCNDDADCVGAGGERRAQCRYDREKKRWACSSDECHRY